MKLSAQWCAPKVCITSRFHHCLLSIEPSHWHMIQNQIKHGTQMVVFLCRTLLHRNGAWCQTSLLESFLVPVSQGLQKWEHSQVYYCSTNLGSFFPITISVNQMLRLVESWIAPWALMRHSKNLWWNLLPAPALTHAHLGSEHCKIMDPPLLK